MAATGSDEPITFVISVAAELAGMHPQTLRQYDRLGLVIPARTKGRGRRYTKRDVQRLRDVQRMSQEEGINLAGIRRILELERRVEALEEERDALRSAVVHPHTVPPRRGRVGAEQSGRAVGAQAYQRAMIVPSMIERTPVRLDGPGSAWRAGGSEEARDARATIGSHSVSEPPDAEGRAGRSHGR